MVYYFWYAITHGIHGIIQYYTRYITTRYIICGQPIYQKALYLSFLIIFSIDFVWWKSVGLKIVLMTSLLFQ